jgi:hypothetical protein
MPAQLKQPIEMTTQFSEYVEDMEKLMQQGFDSVTAHRCKYRVEHMKGTEADLWIADKMQDNIKLLIINFGDNILCSEISVDRDQNNNGEDDDNPTEGTVSLS